MRSMKPLFVAAVLGISGFSIYRYNYGQKQLAQKQPQKSNDKATMEELRDGLMNMMISSGVVQPMLGNKIKVKDGSFQCGYYLAKDLNCGEYRKSSTVRCKDLKWILTGTKQEATIFADWVCYNENEPNLNEPMKIGNRTFNSKLDLRMECEKEQFELINGWLDAETNMFVHLDQVDYTPAILLTM